MESLLVTTDCWTHYLLGDQSFKYHLTSKWQVSLEVITKALFHSPATLTLAIAATSEIEFLQFYWKWTPNSFMLELKLTQMETAGQIPKVWKSTHGTTWKLHRNWIHPMAKYALIYIYYIFVKCWMSSHQSNNFLDILVLFRSWIGWGIVHQESQQQCPGIPGRVCVRWSEGNWNEYSAGGSLHQEPLLLSIWSAKQRYLPWIKNMTKAKV